jgi:hypothetical protein
MLYELKFACPLEDNSIILLEGPEVPSWDEYCDNLLPEAIDFCLQRYYGRYIGWDGIVHGLKTILLTKGYTEVKPIRKTYRGFEIIQRHQSQDYDVSLIYKHNEEVEAKEELANE